MPTRLNVGTHSEVLIGDTLPAVLPERDDRRRVLVLTQPGAAAIAQQVAAGLASDLMVDTMELPDRDAAKSVAQAEAVWERLANLELGRADTIVGVGGGAVTDMAGFVAATWLRGVEVVHVPTTLLAAVDAAIGGKTGLNVAGKNLVGAFWHPSRVAIGVDAFASLPPEVLREGFAEALKTGYLADPALVSLLAAGEGPGRLREVAERSVAVKAAVVAADERESSVRAHLNYGHTIGHGIELVHRLSHGDAVAIGMVAAATVSARRHGYDVVAEHRETLARLGLPVSVTGLRRDAVLDLVRLDKKRTADGIRMTLLAGPQQPIVDVVTPQDLAAALDAIS